MRPLDCDAHVHLGRELRGEDPVRRDHHQRWDGAPSNRLHLREDMGLDVAGHERRDRPSEIHQHGRWADVAQHQAEPGRAPAHDDVGLHHEAFGADDGGQTRLRFGPMVRHPLVLAQPAALKLLEPLLELRALVAIPEFGAHQAGLRVPLAAEVGLDLKASANADAQRLLQHRERLHRGAQVVAENEDVETATAAAHPDRHLQRGVLAYSDASARQPSPVVEQRAHRV
mmetsp:Transcript_20951/g.58526  ORF Transcript_20951/g.58526 Transcript_20951/m.58526 type:complete len:228 (-) Transcript_20951:19-702(-)